MFLVFPPNGTIWMFNHESDAIEFASEHEAQVFDDQAFARLASWCEKIAREANTPKGENNRYPIGLEQALLNFFQRTQTHITTLASNELRYSMMGKERRALSKEERRAKIKELRDEISKEFGHYVR